jgi:CBS domain containing-hemolysin-like protein
MTKSAETVLGRIIEWVLQVLRWLLTGVGYIFYGFGSGLSWIGRQIGKFGGIAQIGKEKKSAQKDERSERGEEVVETPVVSQVNQERAVEKALEIDVPTSKAEILAVIESAPYKVFPKDERRLVEAVLTLKERPVREIMVPKDKIVYVNSNELLGPLVLDQLYRSKLLHFPVKNAKNEVVGAIHTASLNSLEVKESFRAGEILDPNIYYIRDDYTMADALDTFLRNGCHFCLVVNNYGKVVGMVNFSDLTMEIFGDLKIDDFQRDDDSLAVAKRRFPIEVK